MGKEKNASFNDDLVSIIMPAFNSANYIYESIDSVIKQTYNHWELLIVDDCSSDNTIEIAKSFNDNRIRIIKLANHSGVATARNTALLVAKGEWIAFLDSDDLWFPNKLEEQISFMKENSCSFSYTNYEKIDETGNKLNVLCTGPRVLNKKAFYRYCYPGCLTVMYSRKLLPNLQIEEISINSDYAMWLIVCKIADCFLLDKTLALYRVRKNSVSRAILIKKIKNHYDLFHRNDGKSFISSMFHTLSNLWYGFWKKRLYERKIKK